MAAYSITPGTDTFIVIYTSKDKDTYLGQTYARSGQTTTLAYDAGNVDAFTSFSSFNFALAGVGQPTTSFNPFEDDPPAAPDVYS